MARIYTIEEYTDMILIYGEALKNGNEAMRLYQERFPYRRHPTDKTFKALEQRLRETGILNKPKFISRRKLQRKSRIYRFEEEVLQRYRDQPSKNAEEIAHAMSVDVTAVKQVLYEHFSIYDPRKAQEMESDNFIPRANICRWFLKQIEQEPHFLHFVLFSDESAFIIEDSHNNSENKSPFKHAKKCPDHFIVNVWAGLIGDHLIGPYIFPSQITGYTYLTFLQEILPELLEDVPLNIRRQIWFQHCGTSPHFTFNIREYLNKTYGDKWIGRGGPVAWPPRSPNLTPLDFFLWRHLKSLVYETPVNTKEELVESIMAAAKIIRETPGIFEKVRQNMIRRFKSCNETDDCYFEEFL